MGVGGVEAWEGAARAVHDATGIDAPVSAFDLAIGCGLRVVAGARGGAFLDGERLEYDATARPVRQHGLIAHEVAHWALRWCGEDDPEDAARYTSGALMLPRAGFDRDLRATAWDLDALRAKHLHCSAEMIARRIVELRDAIVTIIDHGRVRARVYSPWLVTPAELMRLTQLEREIADEALATGEVQRADQLLAAYPLFEGQWRRVIVIAEAQQLSLRL